jgi:hypothetical protein
LHAMLELEGAFFADRFGNGLSHFCSRLGRNVLLYPIPNRSLGFLEELLPSWRISVQSALMR